MFDAFHSTIKIIYFNKYTSRVRYGLHESSTRTEKREMYISIPLARLGPGDILLTRKMKIHIKFDLIPHVGGKATIDKKECILAGTAPMFIQQSEIQFAFFFRFSLFNRLTRLCQHRRISYLCANLSKIKNYIFGVFVVVDGGGSRESCSSHGNQLLAHHVHAYFMRTT